MEKGLYWISLSYNDNEWTVGEHLGNNNWLVIGNDLIINSGWITEIGEKIKRIDSLNET